MAYLLEVQVIERAPWLPYSSSYGEWRTHWEGCPVCTAALEAADLSGGEWDSDDLCPAGWFLDQALGRAIETQKIAADLN